MQKRYGVIFFTYVLDSMVFHQKRGIILIDEEIPDEFYGWWRITQTSQWANNDIDIIGTALISLTGYDDRLRMFTLLAYVSCRPTKTGVSFKWQGAWEYDQVSGTGNVKLRNDGCLTGQIKIKDGDKYFYCRESRET